MLRDYCNPILDQPLPDPFVLVADGAYYLVGTGAAQDGRFLPIYRSANLVDWEFVRGAVAAGAEGSWNRRNFWAPEVIRINDLYHLYYTASPDGTPQNTGNRVGLAVARTPGGPYQDRGVVIPHGSIDGGPFIDDDGILYMYYTIEHGNADGLQAGQIYVTRMASPRQPAGRPVQLISHHQWQEGACLLHRDGVYYLTYSTGNWTDDTYQVRWATGPAAAGPFTEQPQVLLRSTELVKGPGHHNLFRTPAGHDWIIYHGWDPAFKGRYPGLDRLMIESGILKSNGPTSTPQPGEP